MKCKDRSFIGLEVVDERLPERMDYLCGLGLKKWGNDLQLDKLVEELSEFIHALMKFKIMKEVQGIENVPDEVSISLEYEFIDVLIMLRQFIIIFGFDELLDDMIISKLDSLEEKLLKK